MKVNALISTSVMYCLLVSNFVSFFAPFLLILQLNQDKIGCKSEAKRNKKEEAEYESGRYFVERRTEIFYLKIEK